MAPLLCYYVSPFSKLFDDFNQVKMSNDEKNG